MDVKNTVDKIEAFKEEIGKKSSFTDEEKKDLLIAYAKSLFESHKIAMQAEHSNHHPPTVIPSASFTGTFASLVNKTKASQHNDYVLLAFYHLIVQNRMENANIKDIDASYKEAYLKTSNTGVYIRLLIQRGYLMSSGKKEGVKAFSITKDGIEYVEGLLNAPQ